MTAPRLRSERGQAVLVLLSLLGLVLAGALVAVALGRSLGAKGARQRAADLAAVSAAAAMRREYPRLFEPPEIEPGVPNPRHLETAEYLAIARRAAVVAGTRNGVAVAPTDVSFPDGGSFAPVRVRVVVRDRARVRAGDREASLRIRASAEAALAPVGAGAPVFPASATGGGYSGRLEYRMGQGMRPDVAAAFDRLAAAARSEAGIELTITSGYRSDAEQAALYAAHPDPRWVAPPGTSLHRYATELDLGPPSAYGWLDRNAGRFGFVRRYANEPWHFGYTRNIGSAALGFGPHSSRERSSIPAFVPAALHDEIARASQRWNVGAALLSAQIYAESGFNPFARSPAGALGIAQLMPSTARSYGVRDPFDPGQAIDAQAHLMRDLLGRFGSVPLALAAYNAGPAPVAACGCVPAIPETQAYVARILGLLGGIGGVGGTGAADLAIRLVK